MDLASVKTFPEPTSMCGRVGISVYSVQDLKGIDQFHHTEDQLNRIEPLSFFHPFNKIVVTGRRYVANLVKGSMPAPRDVGVGVDATATLDTDTGLSTEVYRDFITQRIDILEGARIRYFLPSTAANGFTLREAGIFGGPPGLLLFARVTFPDIIKTNLLAVNFSWDITFSQP